MHRPPRNRRNIRAPVDAGSFVSPSSVDSPDAIFVHSRRPGSAGQAVQPHYAATPSFLGSSFMTWRCSYESALRPVETVTEVSDNGPYRIGRGWLAAIAVHEASHAVAVVCMGKPLEQIEFGLIFERDYDGKTLALPRGRCKLKGVTRDAIDVCPSSVPLSRGTLQYCWRGFIKNAIVAFAGPAGEMKFRAQAGLSRGFIGASDSQPVEWSARLLWCTGGMDGAAFTRLAWCEACRLVDIPLIWKAIVAVEGELFSGLLRLEPADPRPGDSIKFVMPGKRAEELMAAAGIELPNILAEHQCGPECVRPSRKTSRRWKRYLAQWAAEEPKNAA
jgi:hypothetical protein